jgi:hypothetical protein
MLQCEHEILPDENSHFVREVCELVALVDAAAPNGSMFMFASAADFIANDISRK